MFWYFYFYTVKANDGKDYRRYTYFYISSAQLIQLFFNFTRGKGYRQPHLPSPALESRLLDPEREEQAFHNEHIVLILKEGMFTIA